MVGRDGTSILTSYDEYGFEWQVRPGDDPQLFYDLREPQLPYEKCRMPSKTVATSRRRGLRATNRKLYDQATKACAGLTDFDLCVNDVLASGEIEMAEMFQE